MPGKKRELNSSPERSPKKPKKHHEKPLEKPVVATSLLVPDEVDFPRGGGSSLTPLEYKTIQAEAAKDVADEMLLEVCWQIIRPELVEDPFPHEIHTYA